MYKMYLTKNQGLEDMQRWSQTYEMMAVVIGKKKLLYQDNEGCEQRYTNLIGNQNKVVHVGHNKKSPGF